MTSTATYIETFTGRHVDILDPDPGQIVIEDIAHALSHTIRFGGHTKKAYSVAEHAVRMSYIVPEHLALEALHHDDSEYLIGDMPAPFKRVMPEYRAYEDTLEAAIRCALGLPGDKHPPEIKHYDNVMLVTEARDLGLNWWKTNKHTDMPEPLAERIIPTPASVAKRAFLNRHFELTA